MKIKKLYYSLLFILLFNIRAFATDPPLPPPPIDPNDDGTGGSGTGSVSAPIDMYIYALIFIGIMFILYYANKKQKNIA